MSDDGIHKCFETLAHEEIQIFEVIRKPIYINKTSMKISTPRWVMNLKHKEGVKRLSDVTVQVNYCPFCGERITPVEEEI